jgi:hypothetical protein
MQSSIGVNVQSNDDEYDGATLGYIGKENVKETLPNIIV